MSNIEISDNFKKTQIAAAKAYCFTVILNNGKTLYLTSASTEITVGDKVFRPNSGLQLQELKLNDSAEDMARITGIYESGGIEYDTNLCGAKIRIGILLADSIHYLAVYHCSKFEKYDLEFEIKAEPLTARYASDAVMKFSKTCRATLGDNKCKVDLEKLAARYEISKIRDRSIFLGEVKQKTGYFTGGVAELFDQENKIATFSIISQVENIITLNKKVDSSLITPHLILKMYPGCDRKLISCCKKFNNVLNFRGEPFVPEFKILEN